MSHCIIHLPGDIMSQLKHPPQRHFVPLQFESPYIRESLRVSWSYLGYILGNFRPYLRHVYKKIIVQLAFFGRQIVPSDKMFHFLPIDKMSQLMHLCTRELWKVVGTFCRLSHFVNLKANTLGKGCAFSKHVLDTSWLHSNSFWLHSSFILAIFWLHSDHFWLHSGYISATFRLRSDIILTSFWLHSGYILATFWLHFGYILVTFFVFVFLCHFWRAIIISYILTSFWLHFDYILTTFWLHSGYILTSFWPFLTTLWLHFGYISATFWHHSDIILTTFWLYSGYILATFWLHSGYILCICVPLPFLKSYYHKRSQIGSIYITFFNGDKLWYLSSRSKQ